MAIKDRMQKKTAKEKVDDEIKQAVDEAPEEAPEEPVEAEAPEEPVKAEAPKEKDNSVYTDSDVTMATKPKAPAVSDDESQNIMNDLMLGLSNKSNAETSRIEDAVKTLLAEGGMSAVKDLLSQIKKPTAVKSQFGDKWADYPVAHIVALETIQPSPSIGRFRVGGFDYNCFVKGREFDVPLPVARHLSDKGAAAILSVSE